MSLHPHGQPVEQILFGLTAKGGLGPVDWSQGLSSDRVQEWDESLKRYYRLNPTVLGQRHWVPPTAFSYFEFSNGTAVVLARFNTVESGRNTSHALLGSATSLRRHAMSLSEWDGWRPEPDGGGRHSADQSTWDGLSTGWVDAARGTVAHNRHALTKLVAAILEEPDEHFTVLNHEDPLPVLTLAREVLDPVLSTATSPYDWTYSTYDSSDTTQAARPDVDGAPKLWCVRSRPDAGETTRVRVDVVTEFENSSCTNLAKYLTSIYLEDPTRYADHVNAELVGVKDRHARVRALLNDEPGKAGVARGGRAVATPVATRKPQSRGSGEKSSSNLRTAYGPVPSATRSEPTRGAETSSSGRRKVAGSALPGSILTSLLTKVNLTRKNGTHCTADELFNDLANPNTPEERRSEAIYLLREYCVVGNPGQAILHGKMHRVEVRVAVLTRVVVAASVIALLALLGDLLFGAAPGTSTPAPQTVTVTVTAPLEKPPAFRSETTAPTGGAANR